MFQAKSSVWLAVSSLVIVLVATFAARLEAHEVRPAYLELRELEAEPESEQERYAVLFKQPLMGDRRLPIEPRFPAHCQEVAALPPVLTGDALISRGEIVCEPALMGHEIAIDGLDRTLTDVLVRVEWLDGESTSHLVRPERRSFELLRGEEGSHTAAAISTYLVLGIEHLLFGFDHILFVIGLLFFVRKPLELLKVITAFTVAHSITLALSVLGMARLPQAPVEAVIALSILYLAVELAREHFGSHAERDEAVRSGGFMFRFPWTVAFGFGLLHGFGLRVRWVKSGCRTRRSDWRSSCSIWVSRSVSCWWSL